MDDFWKMDKELEINLRHQDGWGYRLSYEEDGIIKLGTVGDWLNAYITFPKEVAKQIAEAIEQIAEEG